MKIWPSVFFLCLLIFPFLLSGQSYSIPSLLNGSDSLRPIGGIEDPWGYLVITRHSEMYSLKTLKKSDHRADIIMISAVGQQSAIEEAMSSGAKHYLVKPFDHGELITILKELNQ